MHGRAALFHHGRWWLRIGRWLLLMAVLAGCGYAHWCLTERAVHARFDQPSANENRTLALAVETHPDLTPDFTKGVSKPLEHWAPRRTDGIVNPLYPWLIAWQVTEDHSRGSTAVVTGDDRRLMAGGRLFSAALVMAFIVVLAIACARVISVPTTVVMLMLCGWGSLFPASQLFTPDALFRVLYLITWTGCLLAMPRNSLWAYAVVGVSSGLAYLADESVQLLVLVFIVVTTIRWLWGWIAAHWPGEGSTTLWVRRNHFLGLFLLIALHLMTIGPRLNYAYEEFGHPLYSLKREAMWLDTPDASRAWIQRADASSTDTPSWNLYAASHSVSDIWSRVGQGLDMAWDALWKPDAFQDRPVAKNRGVFVGAMAGLLGLLTLALASLRKEKGHAGQRLHPETATMTFFVITALAVHLLASAWGMVVLGEGPMLGALFAPLVLGLGWASESLLKRARRRHASIRVFLAYEAGMWLIFAAMAWQVIEVLQAGTFGT